MSDFWRFQHRLDRDLHTFVLAAGDLDVPDPAWPGLWESGYPDDPSRNPFLRYGINNGSGEALATWRALAWAATNGTVRRVIPTYYRDAAARTLGIDREAIELIRWEYRVDHQVNDPVAADQGFVKARAAVPIRPEPDEFSRAHAAQAGIFRLNNFDQLTAIEIAVSFDASSEISILGTASEARSEAQVEALRSDDRPELAAILGPGDVFVDLTVVRDLGFGFTSYLTVKALEDIGQHLQRLSDHYRREYEQYLAALPGPSDLDGFIRAASELLANPDSPSPA